MPLCIEEGNIIKLDFKVLVALNIFLSLVLIALVVYYGQMTLTKASYLEANTRSMMTLGASMSPNLTYQGADMGVMNMPPQASAMGKNNSTATPTPMDQPMAQADNAPPNGPPAGMNMPANGKPPADWKPPDGAAPPNGGSSSGAKQSDQSSVTSSPSPMPGGNSGMGSGASSNGAMPNGAPPSGSSGMPSLGQVTYGQGMMPSSGSGMGAIGNPGTSTSLPSSSQPSTGLKTSALSSLFKWNPTIQPSSNFFKK